MEMEMGMLKWAGKHSLVHEQELEWYDQEQDQLLEQDHLPEQAPHRCQHCY